MTKKQTKVTSSHWGAFKVTTENDRVVLVSPFEADPTPSSIPNAVPAAVHHRLRVTRPSFRRGWLEGGADRVRHKRGLDEFVELPWDEALDITAAELDRVRKAHSNDAIFGGSYGWASAGRFDHALSQIHRFLNSIGGYVASYASYGTGAAQAIIPHVFGMNFLKLTWSEQNSWPMIAKHTELLVMFGGINPKNSQVSMDGVTRHETTNWLKQFSQDGMELVNVGPQRGDAPLEAEWLAVVPGSDTALMLGLAHVLETEALCNRGFLETHAVGYDIFRGYLTGETDGQPKTPEWASPICGGSPDAIRDLARKMASKRTLITVAWSLQRALNGEHPFWMAATLAAMLGQIGLPGGGIGYGYGAIGGVGVPLKRLDGMTLPQGQNPVSDFIPVARIADMLLHPGETYDFNGETRRYPDARLVYWCGGNPFHHHQDLNRLAEAWKRPDTIIVHEPWWAATAKHSDIVFSATTPYERQDIGRSSSDSFLFHMPKLIEPPAEARDDYDIFSDLAERLGSRSDFTEGRDAEGWLRHLYDRFRQTVSAEGIEVPGYDELRDKNWVELPIAGAEHASVPFEAFRNDPKATGLGTPSGKIEIFSETINGFGYAETPGHPVWRAPDEWLGLAEAKRYPLHLVSPQPADKLHSQLEAAVADLPDARPSPMAIHPADAAARTIASGDIVRVFNDRGSCLARAHFSEDIREDVAAIPTGAWFDPDEAGNDSQGNPNVLTRDIGTSRIGQGSSAHTALVEIEKLTA
jgi:biotin/methionine sulfoxide reductase